MKSLLLRFPIVSSLLLALVLLGLLYISRLPFPTVTVGDVGDLTPEQTRQPTGMEQAISSLANAETLFIGLTLLLAVAVVAYFGWWREVGFNRPHPPRNLLFLWFPLLVIGLTLSGGTRISPTPVFTITVLIIAIEAFGSELMFRGIMLRLLAPSGLLRAVFLTSILSGVVVLARTLTSGPWPEAAYLTLTATCGGFTYAAIRWRTVSIWPVMLTHFALLLAIEVAVVRAFVFPFLLFATTIGFIAYGLYLLRNRYVRADGGLGNEHTPDRNQPLRGDTL